MVKINADIHNSRYYIDDH